MSHSESQPGNQSEQARQRRVVVPDQTPYMVGWQPGVVRAALVNGRSTFVEYGGKTEDGYLIFYDASPPPPAAPNMPPAHAPNPALQQWPALGEFGPTGSRANPVEQLYYSPPASDEKPRAWGRNSYALDEAIDELPLAPHHELVEPPRQPVEKTPPEQSPLYVVEPGAQAAAAYALGKWNFDA